MHRSRPRASALRHCRMMKTRWRSCLVPRVPGGKIFGATGNSAAQVFRPMNSGNTVTVQPARNISGAVRLPGDKSISHRYAMLAALAEGSSRFENFSTGADCASTLNCVAALGAGITQQHGALEIAGHGVMLSAPVASLDCGNSGSTMRMLAGILVGQEFACEMRGDESLSRR